MQYDGFSFPDGDRNTINIDTIESSDAFAAFFTSCPGTVYVSGVFTESGMCKDRFIRLVELLGGAAMPKSTTEFYVLGCKPNKECTDEVVGKWAAHSLWKQGETVVEGIFFHRGGRWIYCGVAMYESNFGTGQFCVALEDILPSRMHAISLFQKHPELLQKQVTNGEMVIQLFKVLRAFTPEFAQDADPCDQCVAFRKKSALALGMPDTATAEEINTELALRILASKDCKDIKKCGRLAVIKSTVFAKMDGSVVPLGASSLDDFKMLGWNAIQQTLIYILRAKEDKTFFSYKKMLYENGVAVAESAFYGESDTKFGSIPGVRVFIHPHKINDGNEYYGALGHGSAFATEILFNGFLVNMPAPPDVSGPLEFWDQAVAGLRDLIF